MAESAQVSSVDAIEAFRASLLIYLGKAKPALEQVSAEVLRTRVWVQNTHKAHWEHQLKLRWRKLEEARGELFNARMSQFHDSTLLHTMAVQKAQRAVDEAEAKLVLLKKWSREMETRAEPLLKQLEQFHGYLTTELVKGAVQLAQIVKTLDAYTDTVPLGQGGSIGSSAPPASAVAGESDPIVKGPTP
jgi:hypothetical protein